MPKLPRQSSKSKQSRPTKGTKTGSAGGAATAVDGPSFDRRKVDQARAANGGGGAPTATVELNEFERGLLSDLFAVIEEHAQGGVDQIDRGMIERAFRFACERHAAKPRQSGEGFITHPAAVAKICAGMRLDTATLCAALLHDTVE